MKKFAFLLAFAAFFAACASTQKLNQTVLNPEQSAKKGFVVEDESVLKSPSAGKARIYIVRQSQEDGKDIAYPLFFQYEPVLDEQDILEVDEDIDSEENTIGELKNGTRYSKDLDAGKQLLLITGKEGLQSYLVFTPEADKIYCIEASVYNESKLHDTLTLDFIDKKKCETLYK